MLTISCIVVPFLYRSAFHINNPLAHLPAALEVSANLMQETLFNFNLNFLLEIRIKETTPAGYFMKQLCTLLHD